MNQKTIIAIVAVLAAVGLAVSAVASNTAYAAITSHCRNSQGQETSGCNGGGSQQTETNENPAGHAPSGHNN